MIKPNGSPGKGDGWVRGGRGRRDERRMEGGAELVDNNFAEDEFEYGVAHALENELDVLR
jgi:hypothetical protein